MSPTSLLYINYCSGRGRFPNGNPVARLVPPPPPPTGSFILRGQGLGGRPGFQRLRPAGVWTSRRPRGVPGGPGPPVPLPLNSESLLTTKTVEAPGTLFCRGDTGGTLPPRYSLWFRPSLLTWPGGIPYPCRRDGAAAVGSQSGTETITSQTRLPLSRTSLCALATPTRTSPHSRTAH